MRDVHQKGEAQVRDGSGGVPTRKWKDPLLDRKQIDEHQAEQVVRDR